MIDQRIDAFTALGTYLLSDDEQLLNAKKRAQIINPWFTQENIDRSLSGIANQFLKKEVLLKWLGSSDYRVENPSKTIALVPAGNIPLVGFHDIMSILITGHKLQIKLSEKDEVLTRLILDKLIEFYPDFDKTVEITLRLADFDGVIATGSNNSARYFEYYFGSKPHIIRKNRNSIAILNGHESKEQLLRLAEDIFSYFGLGCRNVSKLYVPEAYDFIPLLDLYQQYAPLSNHTKYRNNLDYNIALFLINKQHYLNNGCLIVKEDKSLASRIATIHYETYQDIDTLKADLDSQKDEIQCIVSDSYHADFDNGFPFGMSQKPKIDDYADGVDTLAFLSSLK